VKNTLKIKPHGNSGNRNASKEVTKDALVQIRLTIESKQEISKRASDHGQSISDFMVSQSLKD